MNRDIDWDLVAEIKSGSQRMRVLERLYRRPATQSEMRDEFGESHLTNVNRAMLFLRRNGLAECLTPDRPHYRIYALTEKGEGIAEVVLS